MSYNSLRTSKNINKTKFIRLMKTFRLLIVALLLAGSASAQRYERRAMRGEYSPTVYLISVQEVDTIYNYGPYAMQQAAALNRDRKSTRLNSSHWNKSRMPSSA